MIRRIWVLACCGLLICWLGACTQAPVGDSLLTPNEHGWLISEETGAVFSDGAESLEVVGGPITLRDVRTIGPDGVEQLGFKVILDDGDTGVTQVMQGFPPEEVPDLRQGAGAVLGATGRESWWLVIGYRVDTKVRWERTGVEITYEREGVLYRQVFPATLIVCGSDIPEDECWDERLGEESPG